MEYFNNASTLTTKSIEFWTGNTHIGLLDTLSIVAWNRLMPNKDTGWQQAEMDHLSWLLFFFFWIAFLIYSYCSTKQSPHPLNQFIQCVYCNHYRSFCNYTFLYVGRLTKIFGLVWLIERIIFSTDVQIIRYFR